MAQQLEPTTFTPERLGREIDLIKMFNNVLMEMDKRRTELADAGEWQNLTYGLVQLREFKANVDVLIRAIEDDVAASMPGKKQVIEGLGLLEKRSATSRKWDSEGLLQYLVRDTLDPDHTGEVNYDRMWDLIEALKKVIPFTASLGWRVTALKELGMPVDTFCETTVGRQTIVITK